MTHIGFLESFITSTLQFNSFLESQVQLMKGST